jgi:hypothetical protein
MGGAGFLVKKKNFMESSQFLQGNISGIGKWSGAFLENRVQIEGKNTTSVRTLCAYFLRRKPGG